MDLFMFVTLATIIYKSFRMIVICDSIVYDVDVLYMSELLFRALA